MIRTGNRVALYARFSSDNQRTESIDAQIRAMEAYCKQRNYTIIDTYVDEAKSATTDRRPAFQQMINDSKSKAFDILLVHKLDRFARNRYDSAVYKRELKKNGVQVHSVLENLDDSPESIMMEAVLEGMSEYYSMNLGREVMKGMRENALKCIHTGGKPPLGFDVDPVTKKLVINEREAEAVRLIYSMYAEGYCYSDILKELDQGGYVTKKGVPFQKNSLHDLLTNMKYKGTYIFNRSAAKASDGTRNNHLSKDPSEFIAIEGGCPRIVDDQTFEIVQKRMKGNKVAWKIGRGKYHYLLTGRIFCMDCGRAMSGNAVHNGRYKKLHLLYRCPCQRRTCHNKEINRDYLEKYVVSLLEKEIFSANSMKRIVKNIEAHQKNNDSNLQAKQQQLTSSLSETEKALANVASAVANGLLSDALTDKLIELESEKVKLLSELSSIECSNSVKFSAENGKLIRSEYDEVKTSPSSPTYKSFIQNYIDKITVGRYTVNITLNTGLGIVPELNTTFEVRRQEIYEKGKMA